MNIIKINLTKIVTTLVLTITAATTHGSEPLNKPTLWGDILGFIGQSKPMCLLNKHIARKITANFFSKNEPASEEYQILGKEAQQAVGIPKERHVPIKNSSLISSLPAAAAAANSNVIVVHEKELKLFPYGYQKCVLFHEAVHVKYNDNCTKMTAFAITTGLSIFSGIKHGFTNMRANSLTQRTALAFGLALGIEISGVMAIKTLGEFQERRADIEGYYATQCSKCVESKASCTNVVKRGGYLSREETYRIAQDLKKQNKICTYHNKSWLDIIISAWFK